MIRFIHTADIHFGVENYGKIDQKTGIHTRLLDFDRALNACIDHAIAQKVDFFLCAGDAYKTAQPSPTQQRLFMRSLLRLYNAGIPVVIVVGNHDHPLSFGKANAVDVFQLLPIDGFHVISKPQLLELSTKSGPVQIIGIPWPTRNTISLNTLHLMKSSTEISELISKKVGNLIGSLAQSAKPNMPTILAGHITVSSGIFSGSEKRAIYGSDPTFLPSQLAIAPINYVALGHLHRHQNLNPNGEIPIIYSGSIERIDFGERKEVKGFCDVTIEHKNDVKKTSYEFIPVPTRPFIQLEISLSPDKDSTQQIIDEIAKHSINGAIVKILYKVPTDMKDTVDIRAIQRACSSAMHIVGIIPIRTHQNRQRRTSLQVTMDLPTLLDRYFETKEEKPEKKQALIQKALELEIQFTEEQTS